MPTEISITTLLYYISPICLVLFAILVFYLFRLRVQRNELRLTREKLNHEMSVLAQHNDTLQHQFERSEDDKRQAEARWHKLNESHTHLSAQYSALKSQLTERQRSFNAQISQLEQTKVELKQEFELLANKVLEEKGQAFKNLNQESMSQLLKPVQTEIKGFRDKVESIHSEELKQRAELKAELIHLQKLNQTITDQADKLTTALQGQKKTQGNWGELMLENVLDSAGLRLGDDYQREYHVAAEQGSLRPDVVVFLPQEKHLVIDAKTSLNAYTRYVNAENQIQAQEAITEHVKAVNDRINELASKEYGNLPGLNSPEVVILFMPIESAYVEALKHQPDLYQNAIEKNILVATPTTLLTSLNIVRQLWRFEDQSKHTAELAARAERFYNKLNGFLVSMQGVGKTLDKAKEGYDKAFSQLYSGKGNLIKQASEFKELGVAVSKELPKELEEKAKLELDYTGE